MGIFAHVASAKAGGDVTVYAYGNVTSQSKAAIRAANEGSGDVTVVTGGDITSKTSYGIYARAAGGSVTVTADPGTLYAAGTAIYAKDTGTGDVIVTNNDTITGPGGYAGGNGIYAVITNAASAANVSVYGYGDIKATPTGIFAKNYGTGGVYIGTGANHFTGDVTSAGAAGIYARAANAKATGDVAVYTDGNVSETSPVAIFHKFAIDALNAGAGNVIVHTGGDVSSKTDDGIYARANGGAVTVTASGGTIYAGGTGIYARDKGTGAVTVTNDDTIAGPGGYAGGFPGYSPGYGIYALISNAASAANVSVYGSGDIKATDDGINAVTTGTGGVYVGTAKSPLTGDITAKTRFGILAYAPNAKATGDVTVYTDGNVTALAGIAIEAANKGSGDVGIGTGGNITAVPRQRKLDRL